MPTDKKEMNKETMVEILSHLDEAMRLCKSLDLSEIPNYTEDRMGKQDETLQGCHPIHQGVGRQIEKDS
jgi:hypothetical protein